MADRAVALLLVACCTWTKMLAAETFNAPALKINTQSISVREVEQVFADGYALIEARLKRGELNAIELEAEIRRAWTEALETATQDKIIDQRAEQRRNDIMRRYVSAVDDASEERMLAAFKRAEADSVRRLRRELLAAAGGEDELRAALKRRGQTMSDWEKNLARELFRRDVLALELGALRLPASAGKKYYEEHPDEFRKPEAWHLRRIRLAKNAFSSETVAKEAAEMVKTRLDTGADFGELAARVSVDPAFAAKGGLLLTGGSPDLPAGSFPLEQQVAAKLKDGACSAPVDAGEYYVIVQRVEHRPEQVQKLEDALERAEALAYAERLRERRRQLFERLKSQTYIEVLQKDPPEHLLKKPQ